MDPKARHRGQRSKTKSSLLSNRFTGRITVSTDNGADRDVSR